jgi:Cd2+/Zn2+-exporting ATPase
MKHRGKLIIVGLIVLAAAAIVPFNNEWLNPVLYGLSYLLLGYDVLYKALKNILHGKIFDENFLMSIATIGAFIIGEFAEGVAVMLFYQVGEYFQDRAVEKSRRSIADLMAITPDHANLLQGDSIVEVNPNDVNIGDVILIKTGERIPLDAIVISGESQIDTSSLTGESIPREVTVGSPIVSGCINLSTPLTARTVSLYEDSTVNKILDLVENATNRKSRSELFIARFAKVYTPIVVGIAVLLATVPPLFFPGEIFYDWFYRALAFLVVSCPCALVISVPLSFFGGIGGASKLGILVKGSNYMEVLAKADVFVFDKTGTLTKGVFDVQEIHAINITKEKLLEFAAYAENASTHPIALSLKKAYAKEINLLRIGKVQEKSGYGISAVIDGEAVLAGNMKFMVENKISIPTTEAEGTLVHLAVNGAYAGWISIADEIKSDSAKAIRLIKNDLTSYTVMLTGDKNDVGQRIGRKLRIDKVYTELLPKDKVDHVEKMIAEKNNNGKVAYVGDGINDAAVLARADVGIAMGAMGSDAAIEAADIVIMNDELSKIPVAMRISRKTLRIAYQNIVMAIGIKVLVLGLSAVGFASMWMAIFADVGVTLIAILNASRTLNTKSFINK